MAKGYGRAKDGVIQSTGIKQMGAVINVDMSYDSGTGVFKLVDNDGNDFSKKSAGSITLPSVSDPNIGVPLFITDSDDHTFTDGNGTSDIIGELFGIQKTSIAYGNNIPLTFYASNLDDTDSGLATFASLNPMLRVVPASGKLGYKGSVSTDKDLNSCFFLKGSSVASYVGKPCWPIGSFRITKTGTSDDSFVSTLVKNGLGSGDDGIGRFNDGNKLTYPAGHGANTNGKYVADGAGDGPTFQNTTYIWGIDRFTGEIWIDLVLDDNTADTVSGSNTTYFGLPVPGKDIHSGFSVTLGVGRQVTDSGSVNKASEIVWDAAQPRSFAIRDVASVGFIQQANWTASADNQLRAKFRYFPDWL